MYTELKKLIRDNPHLRPVDLASEQIVADGFGGQAH